MGSKWTVVPWYFNAETGKWMHGLMVPVSLDEETYVMALVNCDEKRVPAEVVRAMAAGGRVIKAISENIKVTPTLRELMDGKHG